MTIVPGNAYANPNFEVRVAGQPLTGDLAQYVSSVEYESVDGIADVGKITLWNPDGIFTDSKFFQVGNEVDFYFGYNTLEHVGRVQLAKPRHSFPREDMPTIQLTGYTIDHKMADNSPPKPPKNASATKKRGRVWKTPTKVSDILEAMSEEYGFKVDADEYTFTTSLAQKSGMSDYAFIKGLANFTGAFFWIDFDIESEQWVCHFRFPEDEEQGQFIDQDRQYTFVYNRGDESTCWSFEPEFALRDSTTKLIAEFRNSNGKTQTEEFDDDAAKSPDMKSQGDPEDKVTEPVHSGGSIKLYFGDNSIEIMPNKTFATAAELRQWARQWFRRNREQFVTGRMTCVGIENIKARQVHIIEGFGSLYDGKYYFSRVRHTASAEGYELDCHCRKILL